MHASTTCPPQAFNGTNPEFWGHEFEKHATCMQDLKPLSTQLGFFQTTLNTAMLFDLIGACAR